MRERSFKNAESFGRRATSAAIAFNIERDIREIMPRVLARESAKVIAFKANATERSAQNWQDGVNLPHVPHFLMLARQYPALRSKVLEWLEASQGESDQSPERMLDEIAKIMGRRQ